MSVVIPLTQAQITTIDAQDSDLQTIKWCAHYNPTTHSFYVVTNKRVGGKYKTEFMHRTILSRILGRELEKYEEVDHIDLNSLNNCRENLRLASGSQNCANKPLSKINISGYKGVSYYKQTSKWRSQIKVKQKKIHIGYYDDIIDAAKAYDETALQYFGEFARINFPREGK